MSQSKQVMRAAFALALFAVVALGQPASPLFKDIRDRLIFLQLRGVERIQLHVLARPGRNGELADELVRQGAMIRFRADDIDYLRVLFPLHDFAGVEAIGRLPAVEAMAIAPSGEFPTASQKIGTPPRASVAAEEPHTPLLERHDPLADLDGLAFKRNHPTFDGRGVVIGWVEGFPDILHPSLQKAMDLAGCTLPKFASLERINLALDDNWDPWWVRMHTEVTVRNGRFGIDGREFYAPMEGRFRFGRLPRPPLSLRLDGLVPIAGLGASERPDVPVLWDESTDTVWVDTNIDGSFADEQAIRPYVVAGDIGIFGRDDPVTPLRESVGFTITVDHESHALRLNLAFNSHATLVAGTAAAHGMNEGKFDAIAGAAQLLAIERPEISYPVVESVYQAASNPKVDVVFLECSTLGFGLVDLTFGRGLVPIALDRIFTKFGKLLFVTGNNLGGIEQVFEEATGRYSVAVGAWDSREALRVNAARNSPYSDNLHAATSFGPGGSGRLKPDLVAPPLHVVIEQLVHANAYTNPWRVPGKISLPIGYRMGGGTSGATPTAAAAAALLISGAKQSGIRWNGDRLRAALFSTTRLLEGIPVYQQGRGTIQIEAAWNALVALDRYHDWTMPAIDVSAPVKTAKSRYLSPPDCGEGIYEREGWHTGDRATRVVTFTRRNGSPEPILYAVEWVGDTMSFRSVENLVLPLGQPVELPVEITTVDARVHSAILRLREPGSPVESLSMLNTVVSTEPMIGSTLAKRVAVPRPGVFNLFVDVPAGTTALRATASKQGSETVILRAITPEAQIDPYWYMGMKALKDGEADFVVNRPATGAWEIFLDHRGFEPLSPGAPTTAVDLGVQLYRVESPGHAMFNLRDQTSTVSFRNLGALLSGRVLWGALARVRSERRTLETSQPQHFDVEVPPDSKLLKVELGDVSDPAADVSLLLFQVDRGKAVLRQRVSGSPAGLTGRILRPAPGTWRVVVDPFHLPKDKLQFSYKEVLADDSLGEFVPATTDVEVGAGAEWKSLAKVLLKKQVSTSFQLAGVLLIGAKGDPGAMQHEVAYYQRVMGVPISEGLFEVVTEFK